MAKAESKQAQTPVAALTPSEASPAAEATPAPSTTKRDDSPTESPTPPLTPGAIFEMAMGTPVPPKPATHEQDSATIALILKALSGEKLTVTRSQYEAMLAGVGDEHKKDIRYSLLHRDILISDQEP